VRFTGRQKRSIGRAFYTKICGIRRGSDALPRDRWGWRGLSFAQRPRMLMLDRYLVSRKSARSRHWRADPLARRRNSSRSGGPLFSERGLWWLIDLDIRGTRGLRSGASSLGPSGDRRAAPSLRAALMRAMSTACHRYQEASAFVWARSVRVLAREARLAGFVPIAAEALGAFWRNPTGDGPAGFANDRSSSSLRASRCRQRRRLPLSSGDADARPHVIVRGGQRASHVEPLIVAPASVHESAAACDDRTR
jgi:hypothetical protein